ncbi:MAG: LD-carboxypeptidase [Thermosediminibacteraceae bacterium]|nr:LD-carboxypeptidase [Thermosediminibacteraceae bacterium]
MRHTLKKKPGALKKGNTIGIVAPASPASAEKLNTAIKIIEDMGYRVKIGRSCYENYGYLAGSDDVRAYDINDMFASPEISAIFCMRGGYGTLRILDLLDYESISKNPKIFLGYSDITAIHIALIQKSGLVTFHGPMPAADFTCNDFNKFTKDAMLKALTSNSPLGEIKSPEGYPAAEMLVPGSAEGEIIGGNLSVIVSTIGTPYEIDTRGKLLMIEEIGEEPYRIDRMLTQLRLSGKLNDAAGIILGQFTNCVPKHPEKSLTLDQVFRDILVPLNKPVIKGVCFGHEEHKATIPMGVKARIDGERAALLIEESAVL